MNNRYPGQCRRCGGHVPAGVGSCLKIGGQWTVEHIGQCPAVEAPAAATAEAEVGDVAGIMALFAAALRSRLKFPAIVLSVPALGSGAAVRINVAGATAAVPGSLTVVDAERDDESGRRAWIGRITTGGTFEPSRKVPAANIDRITARLREFAQEPARVAGEHGRLTGRCCFCNRKLDDERSTAVGYGPVCADHFDLPWGADAQPKEPAKAAPEARPSLLEMARQIEART